MTSSVVVEGFHRLNEALHRVHGTALASLLEESEHKVEVRFRTVLRNMEAYATEVRRQAKASRASGIKRMQLAQRQAYEAERRLRALEAQQDDEVATLRRTHAICEARVEAVVAVARPAVEAAEAWQQHTDTLVRQDLEDPLRHHDVEAGARKIVQQYREAHTGVTALHQHYVVGLALMRLSQHEPTWQDLEFVSAVRLLKGLLVEAADRLEAALEARVAAHHEMQLDVPEGVCLAIPPPPRVLVGRLGPGACFGDAAMLSKDLIRPVTAEVTEDCTLLEISPSAYRHAEVTHEAIHMMDMIDMMDMMAAVHASSSPPSSPPHSGPFPGDPVPPNLLVPRPTRNTRPRRSDEATRSPPGRSASDTGLSCG